MQTYCKYPSSIEFAQSCVIKAKWARFPGPTFKKLPVDAVRLVFKVRSAYVGGLHRKVRGDAEELGGVRLAYGASVRNT